MSAGILALLLGMPVLLAAGSAVFGRGPAHALALLALLSMLAGTIATVPGKTFTAADTALGLTEIGRLELGFLAILGVLLLTYHYLAGTSSVLPRLLPPLLVVVAIGRLFGSQLLVAAAFLQLAALLVSLIMVSEQEDWQAGVAGATYLVLSALGGMALLFGFVLADLQRISPGGLVTVPFVVAILTVGYALLWGAAPLHLWVPNVLQRAGPVAASLAVCVLGPATLGLLMQALAAQPQLVADERVNGFLVIGGIFTAVFGAVAALAPGNFRRTIGYVLVSDLGFIIVGVATYTRIGLAGAAFHVALRSLVSLLLITTAAELERVDRSSPDEPQQAPYLWGTLVAGSLTLVGVPPLSGFAANWAIFQAVALSDWRLDILLALTSLLCLGAVLGALGRLKRDYPRPWRPPKPVETYLMALGAAAALWGFVPGPVVGAIYHAVSALPFLKPL